MGTSKLKVENLKNGVLGRSRGGRIYWINLSKVIGMYLMIIGHLAIINDYVIQLIFSFHMPLFFIMSGMFHHPRALRETFGKVVKSLFVPFAIMTLIWIMYYFICRIKNHLPLSDFWSYIAGSIISPGHDFLMFHPLCIYLWFIMALAIIKILASVFNNKALHCIVSVLGVLLDIILTRLHISLPLTLNSVLITMPFFTIGYMFSSFFTHKFSSITETCLLVFGVLVVFVAGTYNGTVDININLYGNNIILYLICGIAGSIAVFSLSKLLHVMIPREHKIINVLSNGTLLMVGFSKFLSSIYISIVSIALNSRLLDTTVGGMTVGLFTLISFYPLTILVKKYIPAIIGFR